jgi:SAM-dependent methyltransferase
MDLSEVPSGKFLRHPWELARKSFFVHQLLAAGISKRPTRVLDVGSGDAWFVRQVLEASPEASATCWDVGYEHSLPSPQARIAYCATKPEGVFDCVLMMDVAEHVPDDRAFMHDVLSLAEPGATVLFSVPAWPRLYTDHDEALRHYRRYTPDDAKRLLAESGLEVLKSGGLFHSLLLARYFSTLKNKRAPGETLTGRVLPSPDLSWRSGIITQKLVLGVLQLDGLVSRAASEFGVEIPGLSYFALCRKL